MKFTAHQWAALRMVEAPDSFAAAAATETSEIDVKGYRELLYGFLLGDFVSSGTVTFQAKDSATSGSGYADISGALAPASGTYTEGTDDGKAYTGRINLMQRKRYHVVEHDVDTAAVEFSIIAILLDNVEPPVAQSNTNVFSV